MTPLFIQPKLICENFTNDPHVNIPVNISLTKTIIKREMPFSSLKATNKTYILDFIGVDVSWHFDNPSNRDIVIEKIWTHEFDFFSNEPSVI